MKTINDKGKELPVIVWLGFPVVSLLIMWLTPLLGYRGWSILMTGEYGFVESATFVFLLPVIVLSAILSHRFLRFTGLPRWAALTMAVVMIFCCLAAFYFAGEEINWGQIWFRWATPEKWAEINYQQETSIHNIDGLSILNNFPRLMLLMFSIIVGIIIPLILIRWRKTPAADGKLWYYLFPGWRMIPMALVAATISIPGKFYPKGYAEHLLPSGYTYPYMAFAANSGEMKEYAFALVMLLYVLGIFLLVQPPAKTR